MTGVVGQVAIRHENVATTFTSYGPVSLWRQSEIMQTLAEQGEHPSPAP